MSLLGRGYPAGRGLSPGYFSPHPSGHLISASQSAASKSTRPNAVTAIAVAREVFKEK